MTPEGKVKKQVKDVVAAAYTCNYNWYFMPVSNGMGAMGIPDFVGVSWGQAFCIETKAKAKGQPTRLQERVMTAFERAGGKVFLVAGLDSPELARLDGWLRRDTGGSVAARTEDQ